MSIISRSLLLSLFVLCACPALPVSAETITKKLATALDLPSTVTLVKQTMRTYKVTKEVEDGTVFIEMDEDDYTETTTSKWTVQSGSAGNKGGVMTSPKQGVSCVVSGFTMDKTTEADARCARLHFKVFGPGVFRFWYKTSCDDSDGIRVYVDGEESMDFMLTGGYGEDIDWEQAEIAVDGGLAETGPYAGSYEHEVIIEFFKDEPQYQYDSYADKDVYSYDPQGRKEPDKREYDDDENKKLDKEEQANYDQALADYKAALLWFRNCIWLDGVSWQPTPVELAFMQDSETAHLDGLSLEFSTNVLDYGYHIRYTLDGTEPKTTSPVFVLTAEETEAIELTTTTTVRAAVFTGTLTAPKALSPAVTVEGTFRIQSSAPTLALAEAQPSLESLSLTVTAAHAEATIYYTLDGRTPTAGSPTLVSGGTLTVTDTTPVKAICVRRGTETSEVAQFVATRCATPVVYANDDNSPRAVYVLPDGGAGIKVLALLSAEAEGETISYSLNGGSWQPWSGALTLAPENEDSPASLSVRSCRAGSLPSEPIEMGVYREKSFVLGGTSGAMPLAQGWNLISVPCHLSDKSAKDLLECEMFEMTSDGSYARPTELREHGAYWLYVGADEAPRLTLTGASVTSAPEPGKGWTMQGLPSGASLSGEEVWQFRKGRWERAAETAVQGCGYVIHR